MKENKENSSPSVNLANLDHTKPCWYWDKKDLAHTPSQLEGLDPATEARYRREGARFIFDVGTRLGLYPLNWCWYEMSVCVGIFRMKRTRELMCLVSCSNVP